MAVTFGNSAYDTSTNTPVSYNNNGDFLIVTINSTSDDITAVTYNGVSMTQIGTSQYHTVFARYFTKWGLVNPAQGANDIAITGGANRYLGMLSILGVDQTTPYTGLNTAAGTAANPTIAVTTTVDNAFVVASGLVENTPTAGANTTLELTVTGGSSYIFRSTNAVTPAGAFTINTTATSGEYLFKGIGVNPVSASNTGFFQFM